MIITIKENKTFDSELQRSEKFGLTGPDAEDLLSLRMRVCLVQVNPPNNKGSFPFHHPLGEVFEAQRWSDAEWKLFCDRYAYLTTEHWNANYMLVPSPHVRNVKRFD